MEAVKSERRRLTRDDILSIQDLGSAEIFVEQWGGSVVVRGMTAAERADFATKAAADELPSDIQAMMVQMCVIDDNGAQMFSESDVAALAGKSGQALEIVSRKIMELSGMTTDIEEAEKN